MRDDSLIFALDRWRNHRMSGAATCDRVAELSTHARHENRYVATDTQVTCKAKTRRTHTKLQRLLHVWRIATRSVTPQ